MALVVFGFTYLIAAAVFMTVTALATGDRAKSFKTVSPGLLPVLGVIFGLFVAFTAAQVWGDSDRAHSAVSREASALRAVVLLSAGLPAENGAKLRGLVRAYIEQAKTVEWPMMARQTASLHGSPPSLVEALQLVIALKGQDQQVVQRELISALQSAFDARRQRIIVSQAEVNAVKWWCLYLLAVCEMLALAMIHCENRLASALTLGLFTTGVAAAVLLVVAHDRPFTGQISISPEPLLQVMPGDS
ncbi:DUF4239 domain-containing protein [Bradyrhizobium tropiciagri]|uniref:bestrophin-like domain n=1 Tax=Bradyrhizobium tropiciagri TaxID=312253 RepID=UPI0020131305|nr:DUF4239 domain-containing protein [Bradyrhizobium tropiciagri]